MKQASAKSVLAAPSVEDEVLRDLFRASAILSRRARLNGASRQEMLLGHLATREGLMADGIVDAPFTQGKLAQIMGITSQTLGETIARMEAEGTIARNSCDSDRRSTYVTLTDAGRAAALTVVEGRRAFARESLSCFSEGEKKRLVALLGKLNEFL